MQKILWAFTQTQTFIKIINLDWNWNSIQIWIEYWNSVSVSIVSYEGSNLMKYLSHFVILVSFTCQLDLGRLELSICLLISMMMGSDRFRMQNLLLLMSLMFILVFAALMLHSDELLLINSLDLAILFICSSFWLIEVSFISISTSIFSSAHSSSLIFYHEMSYPMINMQN